MLAPRPSRSLDLPCALLPELQRNKDTVRRGALDAEVPIHKQEHLTQIYINKRHKHVEKFFFAPAEDGGGLASRPQTAFNRHVSRRRASIQQHQEQLEASQQLPSAPWMMKSSKSMHALPVVKPRFHEADFTQPRQLLVDTTNRSTYR